MKAVIFGFILLLGLQAFPQDIAAGEPFVRVYDLEGKKFNKGRLQRITEDALILRKNGREVEIPASQIGFFKTKHSAGNNIAIGAIVGAVSLAAAASTTDSWALTNEEMAIAGGVWGVAIGSAVGWITSLFKSSKTYIIDGDAAKLRGL